MGKFKLDNSAKIILVLNMMDILEDGIYKGFCSAFTTSLSENFYVEYFRSCEYHTLILERFDEIMKYKPNELRRDLFWFPVDKDGLKKRIDILNEILDELTTK